ncbi:MAG: DUF362 domain-containing protein [archaeon]|nr:DUF362 domain-containing protein [archaeon]
MEGSSKSKVYFTKIISPEKVLEMYKILNKELPGKVAIKVHSGEKGNQNFLKPEFFKPVADYVKGTLVECNTAYNGARGTTENHMALLEEHGWLKTYPNNFELLDAEGDFVLEIPNGKLIKKCWFGKGMQKYNSALILSHFKGHFSGGFGGAMKQLSIGFASSKGKAWQHSGGTFESEKMSKEHRCTSERFQEAMSDAASSIIKFFNGNIAYVNVMKNISIDCDCAKAAKPPCMKDIGILSSVDPVALDKACFDLINNSDEEGKKDLLERIEDRKAVYGNQCFANLGCGSVEYELINVDN